MSSPPFGVSFPRVGIDIPSPPQPAEFHLLADSMPSRLISAMKAFEASLEATDEVGACLAHFGSTVIIHVDSVGFRNPHLIVFSGRNSDGAKVQLLQHMSQVNLLLVPVKPLPGASPRKIGFNSETAAEERPQKP